MMYDINYQPLLARQMWNMYARERQSLADIQDDWDDLHDRLSDMLDDVIEEWDQLHPVGSMMNGLGTNGSDLDICLIEYSDYSSVDVARKICSALRNEYSGYNASNVYYIPDIPLVHFRDEQTGLEVDLGINSRASLKNTSFIKYYAGLDARVKPLLTIIKLWAESEGINEPSRQGLSSYSLSLMAIHYLQSRCKPPILPCVDPKDIDGSDDYITIRQPNVNIGDLFCGFLRYYTQDFDFNQKAISVRLGRAIDKSSSKLFLSPRGGYYRICIEEPFALTNTAKAVHGDGAFKKIKYAFETSYQALKETPDLKKVIS